ncbi:hypothetical protein ACLB2K_006902 [Fragaria x ananassa]
MVFLGSLRALRAVWRVLKRTKPLLLAFPVGLSITRFEFSTSPRGSKAETKILWWETSVSAVRRMRLMTEESAEATEVMRELSCSFRDASDVRPARKGTSPAFDS